MVKAEIEHDKLIAIEVDGERYAPNPSLGACNTCSDCDLHEYCSAQIDEASVIVRLCVSFVRDLDNFKKI